MTQPNIYKATKFDTEQTQPSNTSNVQYLIGTITKKKQHNVL
jgi:hypothetical protein